MVKVPPMQMEKDNETLQIVAPPLRVSHTGESMFNLAAKAFDSLDPHWRKKRWVITSDGAGNVIGMKVGWQMRLEEESTESSESLFYRFYCGPHQLNHVNGKAIKALEKTGSKWLKTFPCFD